ncbi:hypothetical protein BGZ70_006040 [Mortierella alpina]|uniref:Uncharacterized protein n=1 Tax=Mortierella alpina TaxID=64518 RepID=A0A9P6M3A7_MORAP|nr:hypothetical protein BGZ70_006040 [Mortierella alpina]
MSSSQSQPQELPTDAQLLQTPPRPSLGRAQIRPPQEPQQPSKDESNSWTYRTLNGHAVLDDDDDDAGNELLDTEADEFLRPDADDEIEGTIEGEVLEEEGSDEDEDEDELDDEEADAIWAGVVEQLLVLKSQRQGEAESAESRKVLRKAEGCEMAADAEEALLVEKAYHDGDFE